MTNVLSIDTSDNKKIFVKLSQDGKTDMLLGQALADKSEECLPLIDRMLQKHKLTVDSLNKIYVNNNIGSFTGVRVGVAIANALGFLLKIPINDKKIGDLEIPIYNK